MAQMTERMQELFKKVPAAVLCAASADGMPDGVPDGVKRIIDAETVLISDQFLNKSLANMKNNSRVALTYWKGNKGYQLKSAVTIETSEPRFEKTSRWIETLNAQTGYPLKCKGIVILKNYEI